MWRWPASCQHAPLRGCCLGLVLDDPPKSPATPSSTNSGLAPNPIPFFPSTTLSVTIQDGGIARSHRIFSEMSVLSSRTGRSRGNLPKVFRWLVVSVADPGGVDVCKGVITPGLPLAPVPLTSTSRRLRVEDGRESLGDGNPLLPLRPGDGNGIVMSTGVP